MKRKKGRGANLQEEIGFKEILSSLIPNTQALLEGRDPRRKREQERKRRYNAKKRRSRDKDLQAKDFDQVRNRVRMREYRFRQKIEKIKSPLGLAGLAGFLSFPSGPVSPGDRERIGHELGHQA